MTFDAARIPVILGTGQMTDRSLEVGPIELAERAGRDALDATPGIAERIEQVSVVNILTRRAGPAPASDLAKALGLRPRSVETTVIGGNMPQALVTRAATAIARGELSAALIAGAEAVRSGRLKPQAEAQRPADPAPAPAADPAPEPDPVFGVQRQDLSDEERAAGLFIPVFVYPLFESVLAARSGRSNAGVREELGRMLAGFSEVAAVNPHAWFTDRLSPDEIAAATPDNRLVAEPYTKRMVAFLGTAQGSAVVVTSLAVARELGAAEEAVFVWAGADAEDVWYPIARADLGASPAIRESGRAVLQATGVTIDDVAAFDIYSCFPSAVQIGARELGIALDDPRRLTVTGGLPYFGGPGSNYVGHSIATMVERVRSRVDGEDSLGLVTGVGWYLTKHSMGLYGASPPPSGGFSAVSPPAEADGSVSAGGPALAVTSAVDEPTPGEVVAGTVIYDRQGAPTSAPVIVRLPDGSRLAATAAPEQLTAAAQAAAERPLVGRNVRILPAATPAPTYALD